MNQKAQAAMVRTGKPYGGKIIACEFDVYTPSKPVEGRTKVMVARGFLEDDPRNRFGRGPLGLPPLMRTSYIVNRTQRYIETRNTIYTYSEVNGQ